MGVSTRHSFLIVAGGAWLTLFGLSATAYAQDAARNYAELSAQADSIERYNAYLDRTLVAQQAEIGALQQQLAGIDATGADFALLIQRMFDELEKFVAADLPFQTEERTQRLDRLREMMTNPETSVAEKYRRLLEAYQIEMEYGRTMESYVGNLTDKGEVHFVRLGRVSLMYTNADGTESGYWDATQKAWVADSDYDAGIHHAMRIATEEATADLITVPVPAATEGR